MVRSYSETSGDVFSTREIALWARAIKIVARVQPPSGKEIRCHELARAAGLVLGLEHQDGHYGGVAHTWLWVERPQETDLTKYTRLGYPNILDVYAVGKMPQVILVDAKHTILPHVGWAYRPGKEREDVDEALVDHLAGQMQL